MRIPSPRPLIHRSLCVALLALCAAGCAPADPAEMPPDEASAAAVAALERETGTAWTVRFHPDVATPALLEGRTARLLASSGSGALTEARRFLAEHPALFRVDPRDELDEGDTSARDEVGMVHLRVAQRHGGLPVLGHELRLHFDGEGALVRLDGRVAPLRAPERLAPALTVDDATAVARAVLPPGATLLAPELLLDAVVETGITGARLDDGVPARLAFRVEALVDDDTAPLRVALLIDAQTGEVYRRDHLLDELRGTGSGVFGDRREFEVAARGKRFYLEDAGAGSPMQRVYSAGGAARLPGTQVSSDRIDRWDQVAVGQGAAVDVAAFLEAAHGYFARVHGRRGPFDRGDGIRATVHYGRAYANAFWNGKQLAFGDGDGVRLAPLGAALDVVAHEYTHAVSEGAARLGHRGEAGALNEGLSDVFACFVERAVLGRAANWTVGERVVLSPGGARYGLRDLSAPWHTHHPSHLAETVDSAADAGGVHANATIVGHAAYLLAEGGTHALSGVHVEGIGVELSERIFYRALTRYLGPTSGFRDLADSTVTAARDLKGKNAAAVRSVQRAWQAVGVLPGG